MICILKRCALQGYWRCFKASYIIRFW